MPELAQMPDLDAAMARLEAAEAAETAPPEPAFVQKEAETTQQQPAAEQTSDVNNVSDLADGTQAAETPAEPKVEDAPKPDAAKPAAKPADKSNQFAKDKQRRDDSWKKLNEEKTAFQQEQARLKAERDYLEREKAQLAEDRAQATQRYSPEQYEQSAQANVQKAQELELRADGLDKRAAAAEEADRYDEARQLKAEAAKARKSAAYHDTLAEQLKAVAKERRDNPDPDAQQVEQQRAQAVRDYTMEAAKAFPDVFKQGSPLLATVKGHLKAAEDVGLNTKKFPVLIYHAARLTAAEAAAARVPSLSKKLAEAEARVKELEAFTSPGGGTTAPANLQHERQLSEEDEGAALRNMAMGIS